MRIAVDAVLFDLDNTLADRDQAFLGWARWFAQARLGLTKRPEIDAAVTAMIALDADGRTPKDHLFTTLKTTYPGLTEEVTTLAAAFRPELLAHLPPLEKGAARLFAALDAADVPWGIVTNGSQSQLHKIEKLGLTDRAGCIVISEAIGARKPDAAIFHAGAASLGIAPNRIVFVGDHAEADIAGAARAGCERRGCGAAANGRRI